MNGKIHINGNGIQGAMRSFVVLPVLTLLLLSFAADAYPDAVSGDINIPADIPAEKVADNITKINVKGDFVLNEKTFPHTIASIDAELDISQGSWEASLSQHTWENVQKGEQNPFTVEVIIPLDATIGMTSSFTLYLVFIDSTGSEVGSTQKNFMVRVDRISHEEDDDEEDDDDQGEVDVSEDKSIPIIPIFAGGIAVILIIGLIWFFKNYEMVREVNGNRGIFIREKDTGRIIRTKK
ncbi:MAG: hypothetical protein R6V01_05605 [Thermoplasmatota archaeon]